MQSGLRKTINPSNLIWRLLISLLLQVFGAAEYLQLALQCGDVVWRWGLLKKGYGLCHGAAGNAYAFLALYRLTQDPKHLYRACMVRADERDWMIYSTRCTSDQTTARINCGAVAGHPSQLASKILEPWQQVELREKVLFIRGSPVSICMHNVEGASLCMHVWQRLIPKKNILGGRI